MQCKTINIQNHGDLLTVLYVMARNQRAELTLMKSPTELKDLDLNDVLWCVNDGSTFFQIAKLNDDNFRFIVRPQAGYQCQYLYKSNSKELIPIIDIAHFDTDPNKALLTQFLIQQNNSCTYNKFEILEGPNEKVFSIYPYELRFINSTTRFFFLDKKLGQGASKVALKIAYSGIFTNEGLKITLADGALLENLKTDSIHRQMFIKEYYMSKLYEAAQKTTLAEQILIVADSLHNAWLTQISKALTEIVKYLSEISRDKAIIKFQNLEKSLAVIRQKFNVIAGRLQAISNNFPKTEETTLKRIANSIISSRYYFYKFSSDKYSMLQPRFDMTLEQYTRYVLPQFDGEERFRKACEDFLLLARQFYYFQLTTGIHQDLKPVNIFVNVDQYGRITNLTIADYDLSVFLYAEGLPRNPNIGTAVYRDYQTFFNGKKISKFGDVWSIGLIFMELLGVKLEVMPDGYFSKFTSLNQEFKDAMKNVYQNNKDELQNCIYGSDAFKKELLDFISKFFKPVPAPSQVESRLTAGQIKQEFSELKAWYFNEVKQSDEAETVAVACRR